MDNNALALARAGLLAAFEPILPGRVWPYPEDDARRYVGPSIWLEQVRVTQRQTGRSTRTAVAVMPVFILMDGAVQAQVAGHDQLLARTWDACLTAGHNPVDAIPTVVRLGTQGAELRATVITVDVYLSTITLCPPASATEAPTPPETVESIT